MIEQQGEPVPVCPPPLWAMGDRVSYCGEKYTIGNVTTKKLSLVSEVSGEVDVFLNSPDLAKLKKLLAP
ncbi:hypothetical protein [Deinococcus fonticola]|uniref:hypothetical protein n=1 Tax=Deinococcus fonticola TaxID=2528713 RepID=UPI001430E94F|nr:hypothetical protein [Deinococcus fonticola]